MAEFKWHIQLRNPDAIKLMGLVAASRERLKKAVDAGDPDAEVLKKHIDGLQRIEDELMSARRRAINRRYS